MAAQTEWRVRGTKKGGLPVLVEKRPKGKVVTVISNVERPHLLLAKLQRAFGTGGSVQGFSKCELQGDQAVRVQKWLCTSAPPTALVDVRAAERVLHGGVAPAAGRHAARGDDEARASAAGDGSERKVRSKPRWSKARKDAAGPQLDVRDTRCSVCEFYYCSGCDGNRARGDTVWALLSDEYSTSDSTSTSGDSNAVRVVGSGRARRRQACPTKEQVDAALDRIGMLAGMAPVAQQRAAAIKSALSQTSHAPRKMGQQSRRAPAPVAAAAASTARASLGTASCAAANADLKRYIAHRAREQKQRKIAVRRAASHTRPPVPIAPARSVAVRSGHARRTGGGRQRTGGGGRRSGGGGRRTGGGGRRHGGGAHGSGGSGAGSGRRRVGGTMSQHQHHGGRKASKLVSLDDIDAAASYVGVGSSCHNDYDDYDDDYDDYDNDLHYDDDYAYEGVQDGGRGDYKNYGNDGTASEPSLTSSSAKAAPANTAALTAAPPPAPRVPESWQTRDSIIADVLPHGESDFLWDVYLNHHASGTQDEDAFLRALEASIERAHARGDEDGDEGEGEDQDQEMGEYEDEDGDWDEVAASGAQGAYAHATADECCDASGGEVHGGRHAEGNEGELWQLVHQHGWDTRFCDTLGEILPRRSDFLWDVFVDAWSRGAAEEEAFNVALQRSLDAVHQREQEQEREQHTAQEQAAEPGRGARPGHWPTKPTACAECGSRGPLEEDVDNPGTAYCLVCWEAYHDQQEHEEDEAPHGVRELGYEHEAEHRGHARMDAAPTSASSQSNDAEQRLCGMGFSASSVAAALLACGGDEAEAVEMLLSQ